MTNQLFYVIMQTYIMSGVPDSFQEKTNIFLKYVFRWSVAAFFILLLVTMYNLPEISDPDEGHRNVVHRRFRALTRYYTAAAVEFSALCCAETAIGLRRKEKE